MEYFFKLLNETYANKANLRKILVTKKDTTVSIVELGQLEHKKDEAEKNNWIR